MRLLCTSLLHSSHTNGRHKLSEMVRAIPFFFPLSPQTFCATFCKNFPRENIGFATTAISPWTLVIYGPATGGHVTPEYEKLFSYIGFLQTWHSDIHNIHIYYKENNQSIMYWKVLFVNTYVMQFKLGSEPGFHIVVIKLH